MNIELSPERALELMREVVAEYGEDHVAGCTYTDHAGTSPYCIAGHVYFRAGISLDTLVEAEGKSAYYVSGVPAPAAELVRVAQEVQDEGYTWGQALAMAEEFYAEHHRGA